MEIKYFVKILSCAITSTNDYIGWIELKPGCDDILVIHYNDDDCSFEDFPIEDMTHIEILSKVSSFCQAVIESETPTRHKKTVSILDRSYILGYLILSMQSLNLDKQTQVKLYDAMNQKMDSTGLGEAFDTYIRRYIVAE